MAALSPPVALADAVLLRGSTIALGGGEIIDIERGVIRFRDSRGRERRYEPVQVQALAFDDLPMLDEAERLIRAGNSREAVRPLLAAALRAQNNTQRLWTHARLAMAHDLLGEYASAARHAAAVLRLDPHPSWSHLEPTTDPQHAAPPTLAAAHEAVAVLTDAARRIPSRGERQIVERMLEAVRPMYDQLLEGHDGPLPDPETTLSGRDREAILAGDAGSDGQGEADGADDRGLSAPRPIRQGEREAPPSDRARRRPAAGGSTDRGRPAARSAEPASGGDTEVGELLRAGRYAEALARCEQLAADPGRTPMPALLYDYGRALRGMGRDRDAAVMFTRCAVHYPRSHQAALALIETAEIYRTTFGRPAIALRLLERAVRLAEANEQQHVVEQAKALRAQIEQRAGGSAAEP